MAPARRSRRANSTPATVTYKRGEYVELQFVTQREGSSLHRTLFSTNQPVLIPTSITQFRLNGKTNRGKIVKKSPTTDPTSQQPIWIVAPADRRRKNEEIPQSDLLKVIGMDFHDAAVPSTAAGIERSARRERGGGRSDSQTTTSTSDSEEKSGGGQSSEENSKASLNNKRKGDTDSNTSAGKRKVTFESKEEGAADADEEDVATNDNDADADDKKKTTKSKTSTTKTKARIGTRSTRNSGDANLVLPSELPPKRALAKKYPLKKIKKNENGVGGGVEGVYNRVFRMDTEIKSCPSLNVMS
ncbi:predicted protein [Thalassiosira pseudonana CCMP1335]|uniref:Uncharacterized protein n=1 Tax=Thalassiosira pseudonana TaxID=35128 RepID=B8LBL8_THAPS|nr:predicted protein [Thalassiosira pseudonana CCMP1335]EED87205.1 predicted protein [Thalassiosira pseudonana CCMP1335]